MSAQHDSPVGIEEAGDETAGPFDLAAIRATLESVPRFPPDTDPAEGVDPYLSSYREEELAHLMAGYRCVGRLLAGGVDLFAVGHSAQILELNNIVLFGEDTGRRVRYASQLAVSRQRFYDEPGGGIGDFMEYCHMHQSWPVRDRAALAFVRMIARPQLFQEGNHRTGVLMMSYILGAGGLPPFVIDRSGVRTFFDLASRLMCISKNVPAMYFRTRSIRKQLTELIRASADPAHLRGRGRPRHE